MRLADGASPAPPPTDLARLNEPMGDDEATASGEPDRPECTEPFFESAPLPPPLPPSLAPPEPERDPPYTVPAGGFNASMTMTPNAVTVTAATARVMADSVTSAGTMVESALYHVQPPATPSAAVSAASAGARVTAIADDSAKERAVATA